MCRLRSRRTLPTVRVLRGNVTHQLVNGLRCGDRHKHHRVRSKLADVVIWKPSPDAVERLGKRNTLLLVLIHRYHGTWRDLLEQSVYVIECNVLDGAAIRFKAGAWINKQQLIRASANAAEIVSPGTVRKCYVRLVQFDLVLAVR